MSKLNCWEIEKCGREPGGIKTNELGICPASLEEKYNGVNNGAKGGRVCWYIAGTFCKGEKQGSFAQKQMSCMNCDVFKQVRDEEGMQFVIQPE